MPLLNMSCGQTALHPRVLEALGEQVEGPIYYPPYWRLEIETISLLRRVLHTKNDILLISGSATYGEEAALKSLIEAGERVLVANSGMYGQVIIDLVEIVGGQAINLTAPEGEAVTPQLIRQALRADPEIMMVAAAHCDTSTGISTPIAEIGKMLAAEFPDKLFMVDAVSSVGAVEVQVDGWRIDVCFTSAQKCLNGPQGLAIVSVGPRAWKKIKRRQTPISSLCLDLTVWKDYHDGVSHALEMGEWSDISTATHKAIHGPSPSYTLVAGLCAALQALFEEGLECVYRRHELVACALRSGVRAMGLDVYSAEATAAPISTKLVFPEPVNWTALASKMLNDHGIALASGFRIGTMGQSANIEPIMATLQALELTLTELGYQVKSGLQAVRTTLEDENPTR